MNILKIADAKKGVKITFTNEGLKVPLESDQEASEELREGLALLKPILRNVVGYPAKWDADITIHALELSPGKDNYRVVIKGRRALGKGNPFPIPMPYRNLWPSESDKETKLALNDKQCRVIEDLRLLAKMFVLGLKPLKQLFLHDMTEVKAEAEPEPEPIAAGQ